jgi:hypothetical protein
LISKKTNLTDIIFALYSPVLPWRAWRHANTLPYTITIPSLLMSVDSPFVHITHGAIERGSEP